MRCVEPSPGFPHEVLGSQAVFRAILAAMASPGSVHALRNLPDPPPPLNPAAASIAVCQLQTLFGPDTGSSRPGQDGYGQRFSPADPARPPENNRICHPVSPGHSQGSRPWTWWVSPCVNRVIPLQRPGKRPPVLLERLRIPRRLWTLAPATFSGGEQQRINVARGFIMDYPVMLLDEPTASQDGENRRIVVDLINEAKARGSGDRGHFS